MIQNRTPHSTHIVLIGGGHTHVLVLKALGEQPEPGVRLTLIAKELYAPYSGMLPGFVAGHYRPDEFHIDLARLCRFAGAHLIHGEAIGIDRTKKRVYMQGQDSIGFDLLSVDTGITPLLDDIDGACEHAVAVKPISTFASRWEDLERRALAAGGPRAFAVVGSGAAGFELVHAIRHKLLTRFSSNSGGARDFSFTLIGAEPLLSKSNAWAQRLARSSLAAAKVRLIEQDAVTKVTLDEIVLASGRRIPADAVVISTKAGAPAWFRETGLPLDAHGFIAVRPTLQVLDDDDVFAVGDCSTVLAHRREKAGVFAVRQGPPLTDNLRRRARGQVAQPFVPQRSWLSILTTGEKYAIAVKGPFAIGGRWVWRWKDSIDRAFIDQFQVVYEPARDTTDALL